MTYQNKNEFCVNQNETNRYQAHQEYYSRSKYIEVAKTKLLRPSCLTHKCVQCAIHAHHHRHPKHIDKPISEPDGCHELGLVDAAHEDKVHYVLHKHEKCAENSGYSQFGYVD